MNEAMKMHKGAIIITLDQFKDKHYGKRGTRKREELETEFEDFKTEAMTTLLDRRKPHT